MLTFGLFLHHVESYTVVAPNNVRGRDLGAAWLCFLLLCTHRNSIMTHITKLPLTTQSIPKVILLKSEKIPFLAVISTSLSYAWWLVHWCWNMLCSSLAQHGTDAPDFAVLFRNMKYMFQNIIFLVICKFESGQSWFCITLAHYMTSYSDKIDRDDLLLDTFEARSTFKDRPYSMTSMWWTEKKEGLLQFITPTVTIWRHQTLLRMKTWHWVSRYAMFKKKDS